MLPVAVTRLANLYGPGDLNWSRIIPDSARALARGERPVIRSDGTPERDYLYVEDAVDAFVACAVGFVAAAVTLLLLGLAWVVVFYVSESKYPIPGIGAWNLVCGFAVMLAGFGLATRWR